jgi:hypothetical protein
MRCRRGCRPIKVCGNVRGRCGPGNSSSRVFSTQVMSRSLFPASCISNIAEKHCECKYTLFRHCLAVVEVTKAYRIQKWLTNAFDSAFCLTEPLEASWISGTFLGPRLG